jgi:hypothetical protein
MRALLLRRTGFAATLLAGLALTGSAVHGLSGMDTTLELAAVRDRPVFVEHHAPERGWGECNGPREAGRLT